MNEQPLDLTCTGVGPALAGLLKPYLEQASASLDLAENFMRIALVLDDMEGSNDPWLQFDTGSGAHGDLGLAMYLDPELFGEKPHKHLGVFPQSEVWERREAPRREKIFDMTHFRPEFCSKFLHHHLLVARDIARLELIPGRVPSGKFEAYQACWAVTVDGRLEQLGLPGFALPDRRRHFSRLFSQTGVLMPCHWSIFQALWEGGISGQGPVLDAVGGLPPL